MASRVDSGMPGRGRANLISLAGIAIIVLGAGAFLIPAAKGMDGSRVIGLLLIAAGLIEAGAGFLRRESRPFAIAAGLATVLAGIVFVLRPTGHLFPNVVLVIAWLFVRSILIALGSRFAHGSVRTWMILSAAMDLALALVLTTGLSITTIVVSLFGPTAPLIASFAWVLAASFIVNGLMLLEVASCERSAV